MHRQIRRDLVREPGNAEVLNQDRIDARVGAGDERVDHLRQLGTKDQRVERDVALYATFVEDRHDARQVFSPKIRRADSGVELLNAKVDGVGAIFDRGAQHDLVADWGEYLRADQGVLFRGRFEHWRRKFLSGESIPKRLSPGKRKFPVRSR